MFSNPDKIFSDTAIKNAYKHMVDGFVFHPEKAPRLDDVVSKFASMLPAMERFDVYRKEQDNGMGGAEGGAITVAKPDGPVGSSGSPAIREDDNNALHSLGLDDKQIDSLQKDGSITVDSYNYRPAEAWDTNIPKKKAAMTFVLHDNKVFVRHPGKGLEKPLLDIIHNEKELSRFSFKTTVQNKKAPSRKPQIKTLKRR